MHRWDRRYFGSLQSLNSFENFELLLQNYKDYKVSYVSKWIEKFLFRNSSKQLQVDFINLVIFVHRWDRRDFRSLQSLNSFENFELLQGLQGKIYFQMFQNELRLYFLEIVSNNFKFIYRM